MPESLLPDACNFIKKETLTQVFSCEFCETFENMFWFIEPLWWLRTNYPLKSSSYWQWCQILEVLPWKFGS